MTQLDTQIAARSETGINTIGPLDEFLSVTRLAKETSMSEPFWRKAIFHKRIAYVKIGSAVRVRRSALERYLADREVGQ